MPTPTPALPPTPILAAKKRAATAATPTDASLWSAKNKRAEEEKDENGRSCKKKCPPYVSLFALLEASAAAAASHSRPVYYQDILFWPRAHPARDEGKKMLQL